MKNTHVPVARPRLSVAMIVRNEEGVLAESIDSIYSIADEIVVLDTGSTDYTAAVAANLGATVAAVPWQHDFSAARNRCLELVTGDWVLWLDAGERLLAASATLLRAFIDQKASAKKAYTLTIEAPPRDGNIGGEQAACLRLMPARAGLRFSGRVRETIRPAIEVLGMRVDGAPGRIMRHRRQHEQAQKTLRADRNLTLAALETAENAAPVPRLLLTEGDAYCSLGMFDQARHAFLAALNAAPRASVEMLEAYYGLLTCYACDPFLSHHQLSVCVDALEVFPVDTQLLLALGNYLHKSNHIDTAIRAFDTAVRYGQVHPEVWHLCDIKKVAEMCLNSALGLADDAEEAEPPAPVAADDSSGRLLRLDQQGKPQEAGPLHLPISKDTPSTHAIS